MGLERAWLAMSEESLLGAQAADAAGAPRSSVSRSYYAAYQAATSMLIGAGAVSPSGEEPDGREAWPHESTPSMVRQNLKGVMRGRHLRLRIAQSLARLYKLRVDADYYSRRSITPDMARLAKREAQRILNHARTVAGVER